MVVTRKTPVAPVPTGSRTNSSHAVPRAAKPKPSSALAESEPVVPTVAATKNVPMSQKSPSKSRHKNKHHKKVPKPSSGFLDQLVYLFLFLLALYAFTTCPKDDSLSNPVCRSLHQYRIHVLEPYVLPPIRNALAHPSVAPYVEQAERLERETLRPVVLKTARATAPYAAAAKRTVWDGAVLPAYSAYVVPQWRAHVLPPYNKHVTPYIARATPYAVRTQRTLEDTAAALHKSYTVRVKPTVIQTYAAAKPWAIKGYRAARPHVLTLYAHGKALAGVLAVKAGDARRAYVDPHVVRIWDKVLELSGAQPVGSPTQQQKEAKAPSPVPVPDLETAATSEDSTTAQATSASETAVPIVVTPVEVVNVVSESESTPTASAATEEGVSTTTPSATLTPSPIAEPALSASSVVEQSAHGMESPVVAEIVSSVASSSSAVAPPVAIETVTPIAEAETTTETETETSAGVDSEISAASVVAQSAHGMESPVVEEILEDVKVKSGTETEAAPDPVEEEEEEDDDTDDFLADIGIVDDDPTQEPIDDDDEDPYADLTPAQRHALEQRQAEDRAEAKLRETAAKRADLEGRMAASSVTLTALAKEKNKLLRKTLVGIRKAAVAKMDDPFTAIGGQLPALEKEADKLFKGLEGYLKKEIKVNKGGDPMERTERWLKVVGRVEEKLQEKITATQATIQQFHVDEKAEEVNEGMAIIQQVKDQCSQAQGDVGLELSWLADVTYMDWQVYHDLGRIGERFQKEASEIQAGTHEHPPVDPFIPRLGKMQEDLGALVNEFVARLNALKQQAQAAFALSAAPPAVEDAPVDAVPPPEDVADEPKVSILPIDPDADLPPPPNAGDFDPAQVVIGKSPEQVRAALENVQTVSTYEEL